MDSNKKSHSVPVPQFYKIASNILSKYMKKEGSIKNLIYEFNTRSQYFKRLLAVLSRIVHKEEHIIIQEILNEINIFDENPKFQESMAILLAHEMIKKGSKLQGNCRPVEVINSYFDKIKAEYERIDMHKFDDQPKLPKYARINTLLNTAESFHEEMKKDEWILIRSDTMNYKKFLKKARNLKETEYMTDLHVENLLVFPHNMEFWCTDMYKKNLIIVQNKACCLVPAMMTIIDGGITVDACAAPGNKTSHIAAILQNKGKIIAVDSCKKRLDRMKNFLNIRGASHVELKNCDFTSLSLEEKEKVHTIFVDPSCSNTGVLENKVDKGRLISLRHFQATILNSALEYPNVQQVIYSTCSITEEENEFVVKCGLTHENFELEDLSQRINNWISFGLEKYSFGSKCLRSYKTDLCQGFFIAKFVRKNDRSGNDSKERNTVENHNENYESIPHKKKKRAKAMENHSENNDSVPHKKKQRTI